MSKQDISKSDSIIQKEKELEQLEKGRKRLNTNLKRNKTILEKEKTKMEEFQREYGNFYLKKTSEIDEVRKTIDALFQKALKSKKISREDKAALRATYKDMKKEDFFEGEAEFDEEAFQKQVEEEFEQNKGRFFESFEQKPKKEDQKEIRKIFVRLAARFHPDKAQSEKEAENFHKLMQQINQAYQHGDIDELLQLEKQYANMDLKEESPLDGTALMSLVEEKLVKMLKEKEMLENQLQRVKTETKQLRQTEMGRVYKDYKSISKWSEEPMSELNYEVQMQLDSLEGLAEMLEEVIRTGKFPEMPPVPSHRFSGEGNPFEQMNEDEMEDLLSALESIFDGGKKSKNKRWQR
ncbi:MAG: hypothetical protein ACI85I_000621 [Arenicella sp.]|jgi:hypothetical protein